MVKVKRLYSVKRKKSILRNKIFWEFLGGGIALLSFCYFLIFSNFFQINNIKIIGCEKVNPRTVKEIINNNSNTRILFWPTKSIFIISQRSLEKKVLKYFPQIEKLRIRKKLPNSLIVSLNERKPAVCFCREKNCFLVDKNGIAFEKFSQVDSLLVIKDILEQDKTIKLGNQVINKKELSNILKIFSGLKNFKIEFAAIEAPHKLSFRDKKGLDIYFDLEEDVKRQLFDLNTILEEKIPPEKQENLEYIDLRFGNRVFWKYKESE